MGLFDRLFIDWYWVGHTEAWTIPKTEDLKPYIPAKVLIRKWIFTIVGFPIISAMELPPIKQTKEGGKCTSYVIK